MFSAKIIHGDGYGRVIGYPTANLDITPTDTKLRQGVYAATATLDGQTYDAALVVHSPERKKVEVHLLEYSGDQCYGKVLDVEPIQQVSRMNYALNEEEELKDKIIHDISLVEALLASREED